jgi:hypothetical protein
MFGHPVITTVVLCTICFSAGVGVGIAIEKNMPKTAQARPAQAKQEPAAEEHKGA